MNKAWVLAFMVMSIWVAKAHSEVISSDRIQEILDKTTEVFRPIAESSNQKFEIEISKSNSVSAGADYDGSVFKVTLSQGYLNHPRLTADILRLTLCHEIGHLFGGSPRRNIPMEWSGPIAEDGLSFMSSEGQADYYATSVCFRKLAESNYEVPQIVPPIVSAKCQKHFSTNLQDRTLCERSILASEGFLNLNQKTSIDIAKPDLSVAEHLIRDAYPSRQCRLETMVRGSLCPSTRSLVLDFFNSNRNECSEIPELQRPTCWYR